MGVGLRTAEAAIKDCLDYLLRSERVRNSLPGNWQALLDIKYCHLMQGVLEWHVFLQSWLKNITVGLSLDMWSEDVEAEFQEWLIHYGSTEGDASAASADSSSTSSGSTTSEYPSPAVEEDPHEAEEVVLFLSAIKCVEATRIYGSTECWVIIWSLDML